MRLGVLSCKLFSYYLASPPLIIIFFQSLTPFLSCKDPSSKKLNWSGLRADGKLFELGVSSFSDSSVGKMRLAVHCDVAHSS